jgi:hypothetical protein
VSSAHIPKGRRWVIGRNSFLPRFVNKSYVGVCNTPNNVFLNYRGVTTMGAEFETKCNGCGHKFRFSDGGGFVFHLLRCDKCGIEKSVGFDELGETHLRYLKGLPGPYAIATSEFDKQVQDNYPGEPLDEDEYHKLVEEFAGNCAKKNCNGQYRFNAPPRCPKCGSKDLEEGKMNVLYD